MGTKDMSTKDFLDIADFTGDELKGLLDRAVADKAAFKAGRLRRTLEGRTLAMVFQKPSLRTRVSFEAAMTHLGGHAIYLAPGDIGLGEREAVEDVARVLGRMCDGIVARTFGHELVVELARHAGVPVINALSDYSHPCQAMADVMTALEHFGNLEGRTVVFVGDGNNVARSLAMLTARLGMGFVLACPQGYELDEDFRGHLKAVAPRVRFRQSHDPADAVAEADVIYTDTWTSMGQEAEKSRREAEFAPFQVTAALVKRAPAHAVVMHCLPAYRGKEIAAEVMDRFAEVIFTEAENRLHFQRSLLNVLLAEGGI